MYSPVQLLLNGLAPRLALLSVVTLASMPTTDAHEHPTALKPIPTAMRVWRRRLDGAVGNDNPVCVRSFDYLDRTSSSVVAWYHRMSTA
jgi:hypothetical protein